MAVESTRFSSTTLNREVISRKASGGELNGSVPPLHGDHFEARITVTAYRCGDTFLFEGSLSDMTGKGITASIVGTLSVGELVCLQYSIEASGLLERHARVRQRLGEKYDFEFLSLNDRQRQCLTETCDWFLAANLA